MSRILNKDTRPEKVVRSFLHSHGFRYTLNNLKLPGKPDIVLPKYRTAIFVNGCFWHGHENCKYYKVPETRSEWWLEKIESNKRRDIEVVKQLRELKWRVITIFECQLRGKKRHITLLRLVDELH